MVKPCVKTLLKGAFPIEPSAGRSDSWNQPRCWSEPSRYKSTGRGQPAFLATLCQLQPDSNHTSKMFSSFFKSSKTKPSGSSKSSPKIRRGESVNQLSEPFFAMCPATANTDSRVIRVLPSEFTNAGIGSPQLLCLLIHQSGRDSSIPSMRFWPQAGIHFTFLICSSAKSRKLLPVPGSSLSTLMNHCSVALNITGPLLRQQCG